MDNPAITTKQKLPFTENPSLRATQDGNSLYNREGYDFCHASLNHLENLLMAEDLDEGTAPANKFGYLVPNETNHTLNGFDPLISFPTIPKLPNTNPSDGDNSPYNRESHNFSNTGFKYLNKELLEDTAVNEFDIPPLSTVLESASTIPSLSSAAVRTDGDDSLYRSAKLFPTAFKYVDDMLMEGNLENAPANVLEYINFTDGTPVDSFDPDPFPTNPLSSSVVFGLGEDSFYNSETTVCPYPVLNYIKDMLMEVGVEDEPSRLQDCIALQAAEKSFYDALLEKDPTSDRILENPGEDCGPSTSVDTCYSYNCSSIDNLENSNCIIDQHEQERPERIFAVAIAELHAVTDAFEQFNGIPENANNRLLNDSADPEKEVASEYMESQSKGKKNHEREDDSYSKEGRSSKQSLACTDESEQLETLDNGFLVKVENKEPMPCPLYDTTRNAASKKFQQDEKLQASNLRVKRLNDNRKKVDLWALLNQCAQATASGDQRRAAEKLRQIRQHSSPYGDADQRLSHYFANGLQARLSGTANVFQAPAFGHLTTTADILKAYRLYVSICPFRRVSNFWTSRMISKEVENKMRLHLIDFGIGYGFQWPCFLHRLSTRPGGPPRVRITGIEFPQPGFRPAERVEETGRRLKRLAETLNVPFEYNAIAQKWEEIRYEDLNIDRDEAIAVTCMYRLRNLPDDTMVLDSARDSVLKLIRKICPDIFVHGVINGSFNASFFGTRFREAHFHFSALFDMFEATTPREDQERLIFEREMIGKDAINVIACEDSQRFERPETYKQWQSRNCRIGFRQVPLDKYIMKNCRVINTNYHKDFLVDEDGQWMLMGWRGRIIQALSAWKPSP